MGVTGIVSADSGGSHVAPQQQLERAHYVRIFSTVALGVLLEW